ncbi:3230_t:CDS:2, partial [Entrophospora sp. SA101]
VQTILVLLEPKGQFGTRYGVREKDADGAHCLSTRLAPFTRMIFHSDDDILI